MKVRNLIEKLAKYHPNAEVSVSTCVGINEQTHIPIHDRHTSTATHPLFLHIEANELGDDGFEHLRAGALEQLFDREGE